MTTDLELTIIDDENDDGLIIVKHDLGRATINTRQHQVVGLCRGRQGFLEQMNVLSLLHGRGQRR